MSQRVRAVRHSSAQWAAHGRRLRSHSPSAARNGGSHGPSPRRPPQRRPRSGSRFLSKRTSHSIRRLRLHCRNRRRRRRARQHHQHRPPNPRHRPQLLQRRRAGPAQSRLMPRLQPRHRSLQTMPSNRRRNRSTRLFRCGPPRRHLPPLNYATRLDDKAPPPANGRHGPRLPITFVAPCGQRRPPTSPAKSQPRHRHRALSAGSSEE